MKMQFTSVDLEPVEHLGWSRFAKIVNERLSINHLVKQ